MPALIRWIAAALIILLALPVFAQDSAPTGTPTPSPTLPPTPTPPPCIGGEDYLQTASSALQQGDYETALNALRCQLEGNPQDANAYLLRATAHLSVDRYAEAYDDASSAIENADPASLIFTAAHQIRANASYLLTDFDAVIEDTTALIELNEAAEDEGGDPRLNLAVIYTLRGDAYLSQQDAETAFEDYETALFADQGYAAAHAGRSTVYLVQGDTQRARSSRETAITLNPNVYFAYYDRGVRFYNSGAYEAALFELTRSLNLRPTLAAADFVLRGSAFYALEEYESALADFEQAQQVDPFNIDVYFGRGLVYDAQGDSAAALENFRAFVQGLESIGQPVPDFISERIEALAAEVEEAE